MDLPNKSETPAQKKVIIPVTDAVKVNRPATRRFLDYIFAESPKSLGAKIGREVIVPRVKAGFEEACNSFLSGMLWGGGPRPMSNIVSSAVMRGGNNAYHQVSSTGIGAPSSTPPVSRNSGNYEDLICPSQEKAEMLLANLFALHNQYNVVTVADLYELANITPAPSHNAFGWMSLDGARISKVREGYLLELPRPSII